MTSLKHKLFIFGQVFFFYRYIRETEFESQSNPEKEDGVIFILNLEFCLTHDLQRWSESL